MNTTKLLLLFIAHLFGVSSACAQAPFGTLNTKWTYEGWSQGSGWEPNWVGDCEGNEITYEVVDEVMINGITCGIITSNKVNDSLIVYQEAGKVYFYEDNDFYLLYDFNAALGDTLMTFRPSNADRHSLKDFFGNQVENFTTVDTLYTRITSLDTIVVDGISLKRWMTAPVYTDTLHAGPVRLFETIIEHIGSLNGIAGDHDRFIGEGCYGGFVCYESTEIEYGSAFFPRCDFVSVHNKTDNITVVIFPNPTSHELIIKAPDALTLTMRVVNVAGQVLLTTTDRYVNIEQYQSGMYLAEVFDGNRLIKRSRIIKL